MKVYLVIEEDAENREYPSVVLDAYQDPNDARARVREEYTRHGISEDDTDDDTSLSWSVESHDMLAPEEAGAKLAQMGQERRQQERDEKARRLRVLRNRRRSINEELSELRQD